MGPTTGIRVGDRVRLVGSYWSDSSANPIWGRSQGCVLGTVTTVSRYSMECSVKWDNGVTNSAYMLGRDLEVVGHEGEEVSVIKGDSKKTMAIIDKVKLALKAEPQKTLISKGLLNMDETLTSEGRAVIDYILVQEYAEKMKKAVDAIPEEKKA